MSDSIQVRGQAAPYRNATALRFGLAGVFALMLLGAAQASDQALPTTLGFATAITIIAAAFIGWERQVAEAESAGLVK